MSLFAVVSFVFFTALVAVVSYRITGNEDLDSKDGYFLGGRSLTGPVIAGSLMLTNLSTEQLVGLNGQGYSESMAVMAWEAGSAVALVMMALVFLPRYLKSGITTIPDFLEERYDVATRQIVTMMFILSYVLTYLPTVLYSGSLVLNGLFHVPEMLGIGQFQALCITVVGVGVIGSIYAIFGGLKAVAVSDTINGLGLLVGGLMIPVLGLMKLGGGSMSEGMHILATVHPEKLNSVGSPSSSVPFAVMFTGMLFNNLYYWCTNQSIVQRAFAAKDLVEGQKGVIYAGFLKLLGPLFLVVPGIIAFHLYPNLPSSDMAYPTLIDNILPKPLVGFFGAVLFGAILSSFNSALNSTVTLFSLNIYRPMYKPDATDKELVSFGKKLGTVLAIVSMCVAPFIMYAKGGLYGFLQQMYGFYSVPLLVIIVVGFFTKRTSAFSAKFAMIFHVVLYSAYLASGIEKNFLHILGLLLPIEVLGMLFISKFKPRESEFIHNYSGDVDITPWRHAKLAGAIAILVMAVVYTFFSPLGICSIRYFVSFKIVFIKNYR